MFKNDQKYHFLRNKSLITLHIWFNIKIINESLRTSVLLSTKSANIKVSQMQLTFHNHNNFNFPICVFLTTSDNGFPTRQPVCRKQMAHYKLAC